MKRLVPLLLAAVLVPQHALAWGNTGHRMIGLAAAAALPNEVPGFLRTPQGIADIGELSREPDRTRGYGKEHEQIGQAAHFVDGDENGKVLGGPLITDLPVTRDLYEKQLQAIGEKSWNAGYLPYSIFDSYQTLAKDFAEWRVLTAAIANPKWKAHRAFFKADLRRREGLIFNHIGELSHFVGDGAQPLHASSHFNGWGEGPNPNGYTLAKVHSPFESAFVGRNVSLAAVKAKMAPLNVCDCALEPDVLAYLMSSNRQVEPFYQLERETRMQDGDPRMTEFAATQLGKGASKVRDLIVSAWRVSPTLSVGWRPIPVQDVVSGARDPYDQLKGVD